ncbi:hypothetical protein KY289_031478 [Solanum tuberosum]|nr:hypothetical protein KY289_031478 [Solanum tuberosum]
MNEKNNNGNPKFGEEQAGEIMEKQRSFTTFEGGQGHGGILSNLGFLPSLETLILDGNNFSNIPAASISRLTRLICLKLRGCGRLESLPELPPSIKRIYASECTSLMSIDQLTKYPMLSVLSFAQCHQLVKNKQHASMVDSLLKQMHKVRFMNGATFCMYVPGVEIPEWFTYKNSGAGSISVALPKNWFTPTFRGFTICAVFDMMTPFILGKFKYGPVVRFKFTSHDGLLCGPTICFGLLRSEKPVGLGDTFLVHVPVYVIWTTSNDHNYNIFIQLEVDFRDVHNDVVVKGLGVRLVYEN